jgi:hypothetical protein
MPRKIGQSAGTSVPSFYFPTIEACSDFHIPRKGARRKSGGVSNAEFLSGPQFSNNSGRLLGPNETISTNLNKLNITEPESWANNSPETNAAAGAAHNGIIRHSMDEVVLEFLGNTPYTTRTRVEGDIVRVEYDRNATQTVANPEPIAIVRIAPNSQDWMDLGIDHEWGDPGSILGSIFETISEGVNFVNDALQVYQTVSTGFRGAESAAQSRFLQNRNFKFDLIDQYRDTSVPEITVPFTLFTAGGGIEDFIRDIYIPVMLMLAWSSPKRSTEPFNIQEPLSQLAESNVISSEGTGSGSNVPDAANTAEKDEIAAATQAGGTGASQDASAQEEVLNAVQRFFPGFRFAVLDPPSYIRFTHTSGLFRFPQCAITSFRYNYKGPWIHAGSKTSKMENTLAALTNKGIMHERCFPAICECSLTLKVLDKMYADDWLGMFESELQQFTSGNANLSNRVEVLRRTPARSTPTSESLPTSRSTVGQNPIQRGRE